jgi:hypothetical protein
MSDHAILVKHFEGGEGQLQQGTLCTFVLKRG